MLRMGSDCAVASGLTRFVTVARGFRFEVDAFLAGLDGFGFVLDCIFRRFGVDGLSDGPLSGGDATDCSGSLADNGSGHRGRFKVVLDAAGLPPRNKS